MTNDWLAAMDQGFLVLRKAFDVVNHDLVIAKLQTYGCSSSTPLWFRSFLSDGCHCVYFSGAVSDVVFHRAQF